MVTVEGDGRGGGGGGGVMIGDKDTDRSQGHGVVGRVMETRSQGAKVRKEET